jgi:hypothetical protein
VQIKILSALANAQEELNQDPDTGASSLLRNNIIGLREIVRSGSHKVNNFKVTAHLCLYVSCTLLPVCYTATSLSDCRNILPLFVAHSPLASVPSPQYISGPAVWSRCVMLLCLFPARRAPST